MRTIKVNGVPYQSRERSVEKLFEKYGTINEVYIPTDRYSGRARGYAFVRMENADEADEAYDRVHGKTLEGRRLTLEWARDPGAGRRRSRSRSRSRRRRSRSRSRRRSRSGGRRRSRSRSGGARRRSRSADRKRSTSAGLRKKSTSRDRSKSSRKGSRSKSRG